MIAMPKLKKTFAQTELSFNELISIKVEHLMEIILSEIFMILVLK